MITLWHEGENIGNVTELQYYPIKTHNIIKHEPPLFQIHANVLLAKLVLIEQPFICFQFDKMEPVKMRVIEWWLTDGKELRIITESVD